MGGALKTALKGEQPGTHHMPAMYKAVVRFTDDACQARESALRRFASMNWQLCSLHSWSMFWLGNGVWLHVLRGLLSCAECALSTLLSVK